MFTIFHSSSLAGLRMQSGDVAISLGTSDTIFVWLESLKEKENMQKVDSASCTKSNNVEHEQILGHIFPNPVDRDAFMALIW